MTIVSEEFFKLLDKYVEARMSGSSIDRIVAIREFVSYLNRSISAPKKVTTTKKRRDLKLIEAAIEDCTNHIVVTPDLICIKGVRPIEIINKVDANDKR